MEQTRLGKSLISVKDYLNDLYSLKPSSLKTPVITVFIKQYLPGSLIFTGIILLLAVCTPPSDTLLMESFKNPPLEFRMNLNYHDFPMDDAGQAQMIEEHLADGYGGFTINVPFEHYLTDEGMNATVRFAGKAKAAGMDLWLYDENGYPSGNAGDLVIKENPEWESMGLFFDDTLVNGDGLNSESHLESRKR